MKKQIALAGVAALVCALSVSPVVVPAHAQSPQSDPVYSPKVLGASGNIEIIAQGGTATGGWIEYKGVGQVTVEIPAGKRPGPATTGGVESVGGGTWSYGASVRLNGQKTCSSQYMHMSATHSSRVKMGGLEDYDYAEPPGQVAYSYVSDWTNARCDAFWDNH